MIGNEVQPVSFFKVGDFVLNNNFKRMLFYFLWFCMQLGLISLCFKLYIYYFSDFALKASALNFIIYCIIFIVVGFFTDCSDIFLYKFCKEKKCDNCSKCMMWNCKEYQTYLNKKKEGRSIEKGNN